MVIKIYIDQHSLIKDHSVKPVHIIEALQSNLNHEDKISKYGSLYTQFRLVDELQHADIEMMPYDLKTCKDHNLLDHIFKRHEVAFDKDKPFVLWADEDEFLASYYHRPGLVTFAYLGYESQRSENEFCAPWFANDPLPIYLDNELTIRQKGAKPVLGFCGRGVVTFSRLVWQLWRNTLRTSKSWLRISPFAPPRIASEVAFRARILSNIQSSNLVETDFILQERFLAGISQDPIARTDLHHPIRLQFINNLLDTDYTLCIRGAGNWSMRFYETLSVGRIPVFVDTDSILPFDFKIDWHDYVIWINEHEIPHIAEKVAHFHASISNDEFIDRQKACRKLWEERLSRDGFFNHFHEHFEFGHS